MRLKIGKWNFCDIFGAIYLKLTIKNVINGKMSFFNFSLTLRRRSTPYGVLVVPPKQWRHRPPYLAQNEKCWKNFSIGFEFSFIWWKPHLKSCLHSPFMSNLSQQKSWWKIEFSKKCSVVKRLIYEIKNRKMEFLRHIWCYLPEIDDKKRNKWKNVVFQFFLNP